jgi:hypothetical protein
MDHAHTGHAQAETDRHLSLWQFIFGSTFCVRSGVVALIRCARKFEMASARKSIGKKLSNKYRLPIVMAAVFQVLILSGASMVLDFGVALKVAVISLIPFWTIVVLIVTRRPDSPSKFDSRVIAYSYPAIVAVLYSLSSVLD